MRSTARVNALPLLALALTLSGCGLFQAQERYRGQTTDARDVYELVPGVSTKSDVQTELGSPTNVPNFDDNTWLYIGQQTHNRIARTQGVDRQSVTIVKFDDKGVLASIESPKTPDGMQIAMASGATPSPGSEASFIGQVIGNIGRFSPTGGGSGNNSSPLSGFSSTSSSSLGEGGTSSGVTQ